MNITTNIEKGNESRDQVLMVETFLNENYEFRKNVLSGKYEFHDQDNTSWRPLTMEAKNSIIRKAKMMCIGERRLKTDIEEFIFSEETERYDPIKEYLDTLPAWDGKNRSGELFSRIPGITPEQVFYCSIWLRSAVAHWLGMDTLHGNECVPTLIGAQGCGKSTFCQRLLPQHLRVYYLDHINLSNKFDKEMALTSNMLVNIDELDRIKKSQQADMKQTLSKNKVNGRRIYHDSQDDRRRYASFIATTNNPHPLQDPTGSRRFICITIPKGMIINNSEEIDYEQLYAQVVHELRENKLRYWFTNEETESIQKNNAQYQMVTDFPTMVSMCVRKPDANENVRGITSKEIVAAMERKFPEMLKTANTAIRLGIVMKKLGYETKKCDGIMRYQCKITE